MSKSEWALVGLNVFTLVMAVVGLTAQDPDPMTAALVLAITAVLVNGGWVLRRASSRERPPTPVREADREAEEYDARQLLDIDARLEALERREREHEEAERIRQMVARGEQSAPPASAPTAPPSSSNRIRE